MPIFTRQIEQTQIKLAAGAFAVVKVECESAGMTKIELFSRAVLWFVQQDEVMRGTIPRTIPRSIAPDVAIVVLEEVAAWRKKKKTSASVACVFCGSSGME